MLKHLSARQRMVTRQPYNETSAVLDLANVYLLGNKPTLMKGVWVASTTSARGADLLLYCRLPDYA